MLPLATMTATRPTVNPWMVSVYAGIATAVIAFATALLFQAEIVVLYVLAFLLIGIGPILGYQLATGRLGSDWKSLIGGFLSFILLILGWLLWPILVGAMTRGQSIGKLFIGSLLGIILGIVVLLIVASVMGQNPGWISTGFILLWAVWGGTCGAAMAAWGDPYVEA
jgi:hypothetical protein